jgi:hypothetical protein
MSKLSNWDDSANIALVQYKKTLQAYREYRKRPSMNRRKRDFQLELQTLVMSTFEFKDVLDIDSQQPITIVAQNMINNEDKILDSKILAACLMALGELLVKAGVYKLDFAGNSENDLTKMYMDTGE